MAIESVRAYGLARARVCVCVCVCVLGWGEGGEGGAHGQGTGEWWLLPFALSRNLGCSFTLCLCAMPGRRRLQQRPPRESVTVENLFVSVEPWQRALINKPYSNHLPFDPIGAHIPGIGVGRVVASEEAALPVGCIVAGMLGVQTVATVEVGAVQNIAARAEPADFDPESAGSLLHYVGAKALTGQTAFFGVRDVGGVVGG